MFGFAGAKQRQMQKFCNLYADLGYPTICCTLPLEITLTYEKKVARQCAEDALDAAEARGVTSILVHTFSGNGIVLYQLFYAILLQRNRLNIVKVKKLS